MNVVCPKCKTINSHDTKFCKNCGTNIEEEVKKVLEAEVIKQVAQEEARRVAQEEMAREKQRMDELRASRSSRSDYPNRNAQMNTRLNPSHNPNMQNQKNTNNIPQSTSNETNWGAVVVWSVIGIALTYGFISFMTGGSPKEPSNNLVVKQPTTQQQMEPNNSDNVLPNRNTIIDGATQIIDEVTPTQQPVAVEQPRQRPATQTLTQTEPTSETTSETTTQTPAPNNEENQQSAQDEEPRDVSTQTQEQSNGGGYNSGDDSSYYMKKNAYKLITGNKISDPSDIKIRNNSKGATIYCLKDDSVCKTEQEVNDFAEKR